MYYTSSISNIGSYLTNSKFKDHVFYAYYLLSVVLTVIYSVCHILIRDNTIQKQAIHLMT